MNKIIMTPAVAVVRHLLQSATSLQVCADSPQLMLEVNLAEAQLGHPVIVSFALLKPEDDGPRPNLSIVRQLDLKFMPWDQSEQPQKTLLTIAMQWENDGDHLTREQLYDYPTSPMKAAAVSSELLTLVRVFMNGENPREVMLLELTALLVPPWVAR